MAYVPVAFILAGMAAYTVLAGADFGAGVWQLLAGRGKDGDRIRDQAHHSMGPVWEANHVWILFVITVSWTAYPEAFASIASTLCVPLLLALIGIIMRGAAYALRGGARRVGHAAQRVGGAPADDPDRRDEQRRGQGRGDRAKRHRVRRPADH